MKHLMKSSAKLCVLASVFLALCMIGCANNASEPEKEVVVQVQPYASIVKTVVANDAASNVLTIHAATDSVGSFDILWTDTSGITTNVSAAVSGQEITSIADTDIIAGTYSVSMSNNTYEVVGYTVESASTVAGGYPTDGYRVQMFATFADATNPFDSGDTMTVTVFEIDAAGGGDKQTDPIVFTIP